MERYRIFFNGSILASYDDRQSALEHYTTLLADHANDVEFGDDNDVFVLDAQSGEELCSTLLHRERIAE